MSASRQALLHIVLAIDGEFTTDPPVVRTSPGRVDVLVAIRSATLARAPGASSDEQHADLIVNEQTRRITLYGVQLNIRYDTREYKFLRMLAEARGDWVSFDKLSQLSPQRNQQDLAKQVKHCVQEKIQAALAAAGVQRRGDVFDCSSSAYRLLLTAVVIRSEAGTDLGVSRSAIASDGAPAWNHSGTATELREATRSEHLDQPRATRAKKGRKDQ